MSDNNELISIIVPVYNKEAYIDTCIQSVLHQIYPNWELILVDDESPDKCPEICDAYALKDCRIRCVHQKNKGHSESRNVGLRMARGQYVMFLDADDYLYDNEVLQEMLQYTKEKKLDICISEIATLNMDGSLSPSTFSYLDLPYDHMSGLEVLCQMIQKKNYHATMCSRLIKRSLIVEHNLFFKKLICDDEEWTPQLFYYADRISFIKRNGYVIRKLETSVTGKKDESTYLKKIIDRANVSSMLMETFNNFPERQISNAQKKILYRKFFSFISMSYYSLRHDINPKENRQTVSIVRDNYQKIKPFIKYLDIKNIIRYWITNAKLYVLFNGKSY